MGVKDVAVGACTTKSDNAGTGLDWHVRFGSVCS